MNPHEREVGRRSLEQDPDVVVADHRRSRIARAPGLAPKDMETTAAGPGVLRVDRGVARIRGPAPTPLGGSMS